MVPEQPEERRKAFSGAEYQAVIKPRFLAPICSPGDLSSPHTKAQYVNPKFSFYLEKLNRFNFCILEGFGQFVMSDSFSKDKTAAATEEPNPASESEKFVFYEHGGKYSTNLCV